MPPTSASTRTLATLVVVFCCCVTTSFARIHKLRIEEDFRASFPISSFGFQVGGTLAINLVDFFVVPTDEKGFNRKHRSLGLSLHKSEAFNPYLEHESNGDFFQHTNDCYLERRDFSSIGADDSVLFFIMDFDEMKLKVHCSDNIEQLSIEAADASPDDPTCITKTEPKIRKKLLPDSKVESENSHQEKPDETKSAADAGGDLGGKNEAKAAADQRPEAGMRKKRNELTGQCREVEIPMSKRSSADGLYQLYNTTLLITIENKQEEGLYSLFYHNCYNSDYRDVLSTSNFAIYVVEKNGDNYLSTGEIPLPTVFLSLALLFLFSAIFWTIILRRNGTELVYRIHWIMAALIYLKSLSLFFHGINYHKIETYGYHIESWAVLYYITHLLKGALLFFTIVLIGSGWAFIKHILTDREKRVFMIILPLQVLANVAYIIIEESEEGEIRRNWWKEVFILVDLVCCGAILFPVVWSIRHLQDASQTDGKATISLEKLKLFRHFYIMVVIYIYFTRIIVYLLKITAPYKYEWLDDVFKEAGTFVFFFMTGYKFRPASNNPYFALRTDDYELEEEVLVSSTAIDEEVVKRKNNKKFATGGDDDDSEDSDAVFFPDKNESSHELD